MHNLYRPNTNHMIDDYMTQVCAKINFRILVQDENKIQRCIPQITNEMKNNIKEECCNNDNTNKRYALDKSSMTSDNEAYKYE